MKTQAALRASVSFPPEIYRTLEQIAKQKKVSLAWVVRDAAERYIADLHSKTPTEEQKQSEGNRKLPPTRRKEVRAA